MQTCVSPVLTALVSGNSYELSSCLFSWCPPSLLTLTHFCLLFCMVLWSLGWGRLDGDVPHTAMCLKDSLWAILVVCFYIYSNCWRKLLWWWLNKAPIYGYNRLNKVLMKSFYWYSFLKTSSIWSYPRFLSCLVSGSWSFNQCWVWAPSHRVHHKPNKTKGVSYSHKFHVTIAPTYLAGRGRL